MGAYCTINPRVKSPKTGELVPSKLFSDLKKAVGYNNARSIYLRVRNEDFIEEHEQELSRDENGEFTIASLKSISELAPLLGIRIRRTEAARKTNAYEPVPATRENILDAERRSMEYNSKTDNEFIAIPEIYQDNSGVEIVQVQLVANTPENREKASRIQRKQILVSRLSNSLQRIGISSDVLNTMLDNLREEGFDEYDAALSIADGLQAMVKRANGKDSQVLMPKEMSVFVYAALLDSPLIDRLQRTISRLGIAPDILGEEEYDSIVEMYDDDESAINDSVVGKIIAQYILGDENDIDFETVTGIQSLISRIQKVFDEIFSGINEGEISSYIYESRRSPLTRELEDEMNGETIVEFNQESGTPEYNELSDKVKKQQKLLKSLIDANVRRYKILSARDTNYDRNFDKNLTSNLYARLEDDEYELGIFEFVDATLTQLTKAEEQLMELRDNGNMTLERRATALKSIKDFIESYQYSINAIKRAEYSGVIKPNQERADILNQATSMVGNLMAAYEELKNPLLVSFVKRFVGEGMTIPFGKEKGKVLTAEDLLEKAEKDISVFDRWLDSMAESGDIMLRMLDATTKKARNSARLETIEYKKRLDAAYLRLKKSGITDTSFMFARDPNGHKTGKYITEAEANLLDVARKQYYKDIMTIKRELDAKLPKGSTTQLNIVRVRKDYIERLKDQDSISGVIRETKEALRDKVKRRSDNIDTGGEDNNESTASVLLDFANRRVEILPIMFVNSKDGENLDDISEDVTSSMLMYANMASNFSAMNNVVGLLELVREKINERPVQQRAGTKALVNVLSAFGLKVETDLTKSGEATNIVKRMNDWFSSQVYSRYMKDEGEILGMDVGMLANVSNEITALNQFALNILSGISNVMTASAMNRIESIAGQYFSVKDLAKADSIFWAALPEFLGDVGQPVKHSKLALFMEMFNTMQDFESDVREQEYAKSRFSRLMTTNSLYVINNAGELWIQNRAALAIGMSLGIKTKDGNPISLWDAMEVQTNENGVSKLVFKKGIVKPDGTEFGSEDDILKVTKKMKSINQRMNGIYNYEDRCAAQAYAWGRIGLMFRKWIKPSLNRRYSSLNYNFDVEEWEEGFYTTTGRFFMQLVNDLRRGQLDIVTSYKNLDPREQANLMRFAVEVGQFISVCAAFAVLKNFKKNSDDDEDNLAKSWWFNQLLYQTRRLESEIGSQMIINPQMIQEAFNILKSPAACVNTWEGITNLAQLMIPSNYTKTLQTGRYKGHTKAYKLFWDSPLIPMHRTIYRGLHPQNSLQFYDL